MKLTHAAFSAVLLAAGLTLSACNDSGGGDPPPETAPWDFDLYMVGEFSGWGREDKFKMRYRDGAYRLDNLQFNSGMPPFKVAGPEWTTYPDFSADTVKETNILPNVAYAMYYKEGGQNNRLVVTQQGLFDIKVVVTNTDLTSPAIEFTLIPDQPSYEPALYLKGIGGSMEPVLAMQYRGDGRYAMVAKLPAGEQNILIGSAENDIAFSSNAALQLDKTSTLTRCDTNCAAASLTIAEAGYYRFSLDASADKQVPLLTVTPASDEDMTMINPHEGHEQIVQVDYPTYKPGISETATFSVKQAAAELRDYAQSTTQELRDPGNPYVTYREQADLPRARTGSLAFDALFALAAHEMKQNSVSQIKDGSYAGGEAIDCQCFETGAKWHYVWTRDLSYAAHLGLGALDPSRVRNSLQFKLSTFRESLAPGLNASIRRQGLGRQIVQDTGTGGSWPISTDRVSWALGAQQALAALPQSERAAFAPIAFEALVNTIENDRLAAFDNRDGLYTGEQSFLDWRDQTYAQWITQDLVQLGMSKSLSTNVNHYMALRLAADLATELGDGTAATRYGQWAAALQTAINQAFWLEDAGLYASLVYPWTDPSAAYKFDLLGEALAVISGVADSEQARSIVSRYPIGPYGAPVYFPQQPDMPVYHNRAIWPFVSAYALRAAAQVKNVEAADAHVDSLMRGAALNLSNMENLEWLSGQASLLDLQNPSLSGPVINSQRQLWSVGAYLSMVTHTLFGYQLSQDGIRIAPFVTARMHRLMGAQTSAALKNLNYRGKSLDIELQLPETVADSGYYAVQSVTLNGVAVGGTITEAMLDASNVIRVTLGAPVADQQTVRRVTGVDPLDAGNRQIFAPVEPSISGLGLQNGKFVVTFKDSANTGNVVYNLYRNGASVAQGLTATGQWTDPVAVDPSQAYCYSVEAVYPETGNRSHHAQPMCYADVETIGMQDPRVDHGATVSQADASIPIAHIKAWGKPTDTLLLTGVNLSGKRAIRLRYNNSQHAINLGITNGVKQIQVLQDGAVVASGIVQMPHVMADGALKPLRDSSPLMVTLPAGVYDIRVVDFYNMSYLASNSSYNDAGGQNGPVNQVDLAAIVLSLH